ncbi:MAG: hypothetical protein GF331_03390, partial [Chitinivibrionales bacterium]|nr:hypothetical protein [Chitinivibrionales bacterium]
MRVLQTHAQPLDIVRVEQAAGIVEVWDGAGSAYVRQKSQGSLEFRVSGALGTHLVVLRDTAGKLCERTPLRVSCETGLESSDETWTKLFRMLKWNIFKGREAKIVPFEGRPRFLFSDWIRDHSFILRGKQYFFEHLTDAIELFGKTQAEDGMIYDFIMPKNPQSTGAFKRFANPVHSKPADDPHYFFERVPVEADVEYLYVDALYQTWKAVGDTQWMTRWLDTAVRALTYCRTSEIRWSTQFQLLKRGFTIDTWDFQDAENTRISGGDVMDVLPGSTRFGVFHGDNTGYAASCEALAEMLVAAGRGEESASWRETAHQIRMRLTEVSWNGDFYTHHVPEGELPDLGVDHAAQVSLSNALALNRGIPHEQAKAILDTYQRIRRDKPETSPGEYYAIYPPFERGFSMRKWHYMNGAVFPFVGGELARGALEHGEEQYGVQTLRELSAAIAGRDGELPYYWQGCIEPEPKRSFHMVDISACANADFAGETVDGVVGWAGEGPDNDMRAIPPGEHVFHRVPSRIIDPAVNGRRACIVLSTDKGDLREVTVPVKRTAASLYIHHAAGRASGLVGWVTCNYADGTTQRVFVNTGAQVQNWWDPVDVPYNRVNGWVCRVAWRGSNARADIGTVLWGFDNPHPSKAIESLTFTHAATNAKWFVIGVTTSDAPKYFEPADACYGWLENWNAS